jgi:hypothetical protein
MIWYQVLRFLEVLLKNITVVIPDTHYLRRCTHLQLVAHFEQEFFYVFERINNTLIFFGIGHVML